MSLSGGVEKMRSSYTHASFSFSRVGDVTGTPTRLILHTDGNPNPHTGLGSLSWGESSGAFTIHYYIDGVTCYAAIPENRHAYHVSEPYVAKALGYPVLYRGYERGDVRALGIEHLMQPDGSFSQETRITSVLLGAEILSRYPGIDVSEHATWDPWTRPNDVGNALYIPDWVADVQDVIAGRTPWRTVGPTANGQPNTNQPEDTVTLEERVAAAEERLANIEYVLYQDWTAEDQTRVTTALGSGGIVQYLIAHGHPTPEHVHVEAPVKR